MKFERSSGVLLHITSLPGKYGIGDLGREAYHFVDFLVSAKQKLWQILPIGVTGFGDSPYQTFSSFAGNPLLLSPDSLLEEGYISESDLSEAHFTNSCDVDFSPAIEFKNKVLRTAFDNFKSKATKAQKNAFKKFCKEHEEWLCDYSLYMSIKDHFIKERQNMLPGDPSFAAYKKMAKGKASDELLTDCFYGAMWNSWPKELVERKPAAIKSWSERLLSEIEYHNFLQFEFFRQWSALKNYANKNDVKIIGDIPIFTALDSQDVWADRNLFQMDTSGCFPVHVAGVPPDYFSETGQLWGNPLYKWQNHKKDNYKWWTRKISHMLNIVDILRIDHFRGFDSYWAVPFGDETAIGGKWEKGPSKHFFDSLKSTLGELPIIAEDLGLVTDEVLELRNYTTFPGMKVLQFGFDMSEENSHISHNFDTSNYVVYTGTHDNDTTLGWYSNASEKEKDYFRRYLNASGDDCSWDLIRLAFSSNAVIAITPLQDILSLNSEHRMNTPGLPVGNWQFRYMKHMLNDEIANRLSYLSELFER